MFLTEDGIRTLVLFACSGQYIVKLSNVLCTSLDVYLISSRNFFFHLISQVEAKANFVRVAIPRGTDIRGISGEVPSEKIIENKISLKAKENGRGFSKRNPVLLVAIPYLEKFQASPVEPLRRALKFKDAMFPVANPL